MKIKIEIDLKPEELQRFLGLPDVGAMREEMVDFIKDKVAADPAGFLLNNLDQIRKSRAVRRILYGRQGGSVHGTKRAHPRGSHYQEPAPDAGDKDDDLG